MSQNRFTKKQKQLYDFIVNFIKQHGFSPTFREIAAGLGYKSIATVAKHIDNLVAAGCLIKTDRVGRSLELAGQVRQQIVVDQPLLNHLRSLWPKLNLDQQEQAKQVFTWFQLDGLISEISKTVEK